ncbi:FKBP-type peptidyl-prolyl cis-trans isomerase [Tsuneonella flava]|nr:FKBP-type peptidyl-prolyl cis-trans isomerase [Tsuneonella flava]
MMDKTALMAVGAAILACLGYVALRAAEPAQTQDPAWLNKQQLALAERAAQPGWQSLPGGLLWKRVAGDGSGKHPTVEDVVSVEYTAKLSDGTVIDTSDGGPPATFPLGKLVPAWQRAIPQMGVGDTIEIASPSDLAYGPKGKGPVPGGATLLFTVKLVGIGGGAE